MPTIAKLVVRLSLNDSQYKKGIDNAIKQAQSAEKRIKTSTDKAARAAKTSAAKVAKTVKTDFGGLGKSVSDSVGQAFNNSLLGKIDNFSKRFGSIGQSVKNFGSRLTSSIPNLNKFTSALGSGMSKAASVAKTAFGVMSKGALALGAGIGVAGAAVVGFGAMVTGAAFKLAQAAAPIQGIQSAFQGLSATFQGGSQAMLSALQKSTAGMVTNTELMRQYNLAAQLVGQEFAQNLPNAMEPLQKVAAATGQDMGFLMNSLTVGVGRLSPMILDNLGIQVNLTQAYADFAAKNGLVASSLTKTQQQMAVMDQVTTKLNENTKNIPSVFGSASQVFGAFKTSIANVKDQMGMDLLPTFTSMFSFFQKLMPLVSSFGSLFTGTFAGLGNVAKSFVTGFAKAMGTDMDSLAGNMESWGSNIVTQLAAGMAKAIGAVISVLNSLGQVIASWLAPGSPPKLLPELPAWGENAANWFLKGFTNANVSILRDLSGTVENFLRSSMAGKSSEAIAKAVLGARGGLESALAGGGNMLSAVPEGVRGYAGALIASSQAAEKLAKAQDNLNKVTKDYDDKLKPISDRLSAIQAERDAYVQSQRISELEAIAADPNADADAVRFANLELEEIALQNQQAALEENKETAVNAAQEKVNAAQLEMDMAEKRLQLEQELLQHQIETNNLLADTIAKTNELGGAGGGGLAGAAGAATSLGDALTGIGNIASPLGSTMSELAASIMGEFDGVSTAAEELGETWSGVIQSLRQRWDDFVLGLQESAIGQWLSELKTKWVEETWPAIKESISTTWQETVKPRLEDMKTWLATEVPVALETLRAKWVDEVWPTIQTVSENVWTVISATWEEMGRWINDNLVPWIEFLRAKWVDEVWPAMRDKLIEVWDAIKPKLELLRDKIVSVMARAEGVIQPVLDLWQRLKDAVVGFWEWISSHTFEFKISLPDLPDWATPGSPIPLHTAWENYARFLDKTDFDVSMNLNGADSMAAGMLDRAALATAGSSQVNQPFNMYGNVTNGMTERELETKVRRWIRDENRKR